MSKIYYRIVSLILQASQIAKSMVLKVKVIY